VSLLHPFRRPATALPADCWMCDPTAEHGLCAGHARQVRDVATAQAQPGYGLPERPHRCTVCGELRFADGHHCWEQLDDDSWKRASDR
jgi:hypothetical protein